MTKRNPEFGGFSACFAVRAETDQKGKATPPARTETWMKIYSTPTPMISTHSAREDGDSFKFFICHGYTDFNPLRPRGRRLLSSKLRHVPYRFQPTPPARTETAMTLQTISFHNISTHSAREDGDIYEIDGIQKGCDFNPLRPRGRRLLDDCLRYWWWNISTHSAREDGDYDRLLI